LSIQYCKSSITLTAMQSPHHPIDSHRRKEKFGNSVFYQHLAEIRASP
jgi:hypothetical protein